MSPLDRPADAHNHSVSLVIETSDDDTFDAMIDALEAFAKGELRDILSTMDPLVTVEVSTNDGISIGC